MLDRWRLDETWVGEQRSCWDPTGSSASTKLSPDPGRLAPSIAGGTAGTAPRGVLSRRRYGLARFASVGPRRSRQECERGERADWAPFRQLMQTPGAAHGARVCRLPCFLRQSISRDWAIIAILAPVLVFR